MLHLSPTTTLKFNKKRNNFGKPQIAIQFYFRKIAKNRGHAVDKF